MYRRNLTACILDALADTPVVLLHGARQTGKTTLAKELVAQGYFEHYLTLDNAVTLASAHSDPAGFLDSYEGRLVIDEVQRAPDILRAIKIEVDRNRQSGRYLLTGSANVLMVPKVSESLAGRMEILTLWPLSQGEIKNVRENFIDRLFGENFVLPTTEPLARTELIQRMLLGGYPEALRRKQEHRRREWFDSYVSSVLYREIRDMANIEGLTEMPKLLTLLAARAGSLLNVTEISGEVGIAQRTLNRYLALLQATYLVQTLPAWFRNVGKRLTKSPKLFLNDTGLMVNLLGLNEVRLLREGEWLGRLLENWVVMELHKQIGWSNVKPQMYHFRTAEGREADIVLEDRAGRVTGIEVKASATVSVGDFAGLKMLAAAAKDQFQRGILLYTGTEPAPFSEKLYALPLSVLWSFK
jgi:predicted AAA+ superfamily ATPase